MPTSVSFHLRLVSRALVSESVEKFTNLMVKREKLTPDYNRFRDNTYPISHKSCHTCADVSACPSLSQPPAFHSQVYDLLQTVEAVQLLLPRRVPSYARDIPHTLLTSSIFCVADLLLPPTATCGRNVCHGDIVSLVGPQNSTTSRRQAFRTENVSERHGVRGCSRRLLLLFAVAC